MDENNPLLASTMPGPDQTPPAGNAAGSVSVFVLRQNEASDAITSGSPKISIVKSALLVHPKSSVKV